MDWVCMSLVETQHLCTYVLVQRCLKQGGDEATALLPGAMWLTPTILILLLKYLFGGQLPK